jgi:two-component system, NarL family, nitrate/nitrite response regulator NarL
MQSRPSTLTEREVSSKKATVAILGPTRHYRECLAQVLTSRKGLIVVDVGPCDPAHLDRLAHLDPDVVLLDLTAIQAISLIRQIGLKLPRAALVALNGGDDESQILSLFEAGLTGWVPGQASLDDVEEIIRSGLRHELRCPSHVTHEMLRLLREHGGHRKAAVRSDHLSAREIGVLTMIEQGHTNKEIASRLGIEAATVKNHVHRILKKLAVHRRGEAASRLLRKREGSGAA